jgi:predicted amidophosphoribosyltransferase
MASKGVVRSGVSVATKLLALRAAWKAYNSGLSADEIAHLAKNARKGDTAMMRRQAKLYPDADGMCEACHGACYFTDKFCRHCGRRVVGRKAL